VSIQPRIRVAANILLILDLEDIGVVQHGTAQCGVQTGEQRSICWRTRIIIRVQYCAACRLTERRTRRPNISVRPWERCRATGSAVKPCDLTVYEARARG